MSEAARDPAHGEASAATRDSSRGVAGDVARDVARAPRARSVVRRSGSVRRDQVIVSVGRNWFRLALLGVVVGAGVFFALGFFAGQRLRGTADDATSVSNTVDAGAVKDANNTMDAGAAKDASNTVDAGAAKDASNTADARVAKDASDAANTSTAEDASAVADDTEDEGAREDDDDLAGAQEDIEDDDRRNVTVLVRQRPPRGVFGLQFGAFETLDEARAFILGRSWPRRLKVYIQPTPVADRGTWYRVRAGSYADARAAERGLARLPVDLRERAIVVRHR